MCDSVAWGKTSSGTFRVALGGYEVFKECCMEEEREEGRAFLQGEQHVRRLERVC